MPEITKAPEAEETTRLWDAISIHSSKSSREASTCYKEFQTAGIFNFEFIHEWARLAIAYSMFNTQEEPIPDAPDAAGTEIRPIFTLFSDRVYPEKSFSPDKTRLWVALIAQELHDENNGQTPFSTERLFKRIHAHWHRGAVLLKERYTVLKEEYETAKMTNAAITSNPRDKFLQELAEQAQKNLAKWQTPSNTEQHTDPAQQDNQVIQINDNALKIAIKNIAPDATMGTPTEGIRYNRYLLQCGNTASCNTLTTSIGNLAFSLGCSANQLKISQAIGTPNALYLEVLRPEDTWKTLDNTAFRRALQAAPNDQILPICVGADWKGNPVFEDLTTAPHVLVAGTTGSGKSVCVNAMIQSIVAIQSSQKVQVVFIDPKQVEFMRYQNHGHIWQGVAELSSIEGIFIENSHIIEALNALVEEMEQRYTLLRTHGVTNLSALPLTIRPPYLAVFVDELADLIGKISATEALLVRLATTARAAGIHLVLATQRPDAKTFSGQLRSNIPTRIALKVQKDSESKIILDETGAEDLAGKGDRLVKWNNATTLLHGYNL